MTSFPPIILLYKIVILNVGWILTISKAMLSIKKLSISNIYW